MAEEKPSQPPQPHEAGTSEDVALATEVQQTNRLLEIENMDWTRQLKQAVRVFFLLISGRGSPSTPNGIPSLIPAFVVQGFKDSSLSVWQASCVLRNFKLQTGQTVTREELDSGELAGEFVDSDYAYDSEESVSPFGTFIYSHLHIVHPFCGKFL